MIAGQKVICIDDSNEPFAVTVHDGHLVKVPLFRQWIKKHTTYVVRGVFLGASSPEDTGGEVGLYLLGIHNDPTPWKPFLELGFNSSRFRPIEEKTLGTSVEKEVAA